MATLLERIHQMQPEVALAVRERMAFKMRIHTLPHSRSAFGLEREEELRREGEEIWHRTQPLLDAHRSLIREYMALNQAAKLPETDGKDL